MGATVLRVTRVTLRISTVTPKGMLWGRKVNMQTNKAVCWDSCYPGGMHTAPWGTRRNPHQGSLGHSGMEVTFDLDLEGWMARWAGYFRHSKGSKRERERDIDRDRERDRETERLSLLVP